MNMLKPITMKPLTKPITNKTNTMNPEPKGEASTTIAEPPFNITFSHGGKSVNISLVNGSDVFRLAEVFQNILTENAIEHEVETSKYIHYV
jgi:hypothetical protein